MKKTLKLSALLAICFTALLVLASCNISQSYADKINEKAKAGEEYTYAEVVKKLGEPTVKSVASVGSVGESGFCTWVKGCDTWEDAKAKADDGKTLYTITVTFLNGKAKGASYTEGTEAPEKK